MSAPATAPAVSHAPAPLAVGAPGSVDSEARIDALEATHDMMARKCVAMDGVQKETGARTGGSSGDARDRPRHSLTLCGGAGDRAEVQDGGGTHAGLPARLSVYGFSSALTIPTHGSAAGPGSVLMA